MQGGEATPGSLRVLQDGSGRDPVPLVRIVGLEEDVDDIRTR